jgi:hypothetical protein
MDPLSVLIAAAVFAAGWLVGRHARLKAKPKAPKPICMCGHHYGEHDPDTSVCNNQEIERINYSDKWVACACLRYTGPQPVEAYWAPPMADMNIVTAPRPIERKD